MKHDLYVIRGTLEFFISGCSMDLLASRGRPVVIPNRWPDWNSWTFFASEFQSFVVEDFNLEISFFVVSK